VGSIGWGRTNEITGTIDRVGRGCDAVGLADLTGAAT
jgi:hypothetical protein